MLQWGRADEGAETSLDGFTDASGTLLQWGRADEGAETRTRHRSASPAAPSFNGAAPMKARKHALPGRRYNGLRASMGPRR